MYIYICDYIWLYMIIYDHIYIYIYIIFVCVFWKGKNPFAIFLYFPSYIEQPQRMLGTIEWVFCQAVHSVSLGLGLSRNEAMPKFIAMFHQKKLHRSTGLGVFVSTKKRIHISSCSLARRHMPGTCPGLPGNPRFHNPKTYPWSCELNLGCQDGLPFLCLFFWMMIWYN